MAVQKRIAVIGGDGVGPEVIEQGLRVLQTVAERGGHQFEVVELDLGAERYLRDGSTFPEGDAAFIREQCDAVLLGALGDARVEDFRHARDILFGLRFGLDLYANVRPIVCLSDRLMPLKDKSAADCNITVFRENTEGIYVGMGGQFKKGTPDEIAINEDLNTRKGVERIIVAAFDFARERGLGRVHMADKHNAMRHAHELWLRTFLEVAEGYSEIEAEHVFVDALCLYLIEDPSRFEVIVTCNLFGDIITDLGAALQGGLGMGASASLRPGAAAGFAAPSGGGSRKGEAWRAGGLFEPVHGSAPGLAGRDLANPLATVLSVGMMLGYFGLFEEERLVQELVRDAIDAGACTPDVGGKLGTRAVGDWLVAQLEKR